MNARLREIKALRSARLRCRASLALAAAVLLAAPFASAAQKPKLPRPTVLERGIDLQRDAGTGELQVRNAGAYAAAPEAAAPLIRSRVALVEVRCTVVAPDGMRIRGLTRDDFQVFEDGAEQTITSFDAATAPASIALVLDASPSIYRELGEMRTAAQSLARSLQPEDEVAVLAFAGETHLLLPFSRDRTLLAAALASPELAQVANSSESFIYQAVYLSAAQLFAGRSGRKAIVLLTDGQDSGLGLTWDPASMLPARATEEGAAKAASSPLAFEDVARKIAAEGIELYIISTEPRPRAMTDAWLSAHRGQMLVTPEARRLGIAQYTLYLAELVRQVGGALYFLRQLGSLAEVYHTIALRLGAEYTLGYYPATGIDKPGWRALKVDLRPNVAGVPSGSQVTHRAAYYVPASL
jgi:VWFA-related protein